MHRHPSTHINEIDKLLCANAGPNCKGCQHWASGDCSRQLCRHCCADRGGCPGSQDHRNLVASRQRALQEHSRTSELADTATVLAAARGPAVPPSAVRVCGPGSSNVTVPWRAPNMWTLMDPTVEKIAQTAAAEKRQREELEWCERQKSRVPVHVWYKAGTSACVVNVEVSGYPYLCIDRQADLRRVLPPEVVDVEIYDSIRHIWVTTSCASVRTILPSESELLVRALPRGASRDPLHDNDCPGLPPYAMAASLQIDPLDFSDVLVSRYAFRWGSTQLTSTKSISLADACRAFGFYLPQHGTNILTDSDTKATAFRAWASCMISDKEMPPGDWCLLERSSYAKLRETLQQSNLHIFMIHDEKNNILWALDDKQGPRFRRSWIIVIEDPSTALAAALMVGSVDAAARWLVSSGMPFRTLACSAEVQLTNRRVLLNPQQPPLRLVARATGYSFTAQDYHTYEDNRNHLLRNNPRVRRAALLAGGIVWRLAVETLKPSLVLDDLDEIARMRSVTFRLCGCDCDVYVDDDLTHNELRVITGTYVRSPQRDYFTLDNLAFPAWWPDPGQFQNSALDYGWWTPVDENWYCSVRDKYRQGTAHPKTGEEWRSSLRNWDKRSRRLTEKSRRAAYTFLQWSSAS